LAVQDYPARYFEVIVIDDNSTDNTYNTALSETRIKNYRVIKNRGTGKKDALRSGIDLVSSDLIITTDADCRTGMKWISTIADCFTQGMPDLIIGPVSISSGKGFFSRFQELEFLALQGVTAGTAISGRATMCNGANMAFTRNVYYSNAGNLHPEIPSGDDIFLLHSLKKKKGSAIVWLESSDAMVTTAPSLSLREFIKQRGRWLAKSRVFNDSQTIMLGVVTFLPLIAILFALAASFFSSAFIPVSVVLYLAKSLPDYLILRNTTTRYGFPGLMKWFIPVQLLYPFYVSVVTASAIRKGNYRSF
ncbi:MAG TPA: glycosyltransferase, partial [Bacteroidales bacterium]|nr:glycosyltransferase [Bacteroidales bacterium]